MATNGLRRTENLTVGRLLPQIIRFSIPLMVATILQLMFYTVDTIVIGRWGGDTELERETALAAVGSCGALISMLINLFMGLAVGTSVCVAYEIGAKRHDEVYRVVHTAVPLGFLCGILVMIIGIVLTKPMLHLMGTEPMVLEEAVPYMWAYFCGMPASLLYNFCAAMLRANGDTTRPMIFMSIAGVVNVGLNLIMTIVFKAGALGVGIATAAANWVCCVLMIVFMVRSDGMCHLDLKNMRLACDIIWKILKVGIPAGVQSVLFNVADVISQSSINSLGQAVVAGNASGRNLNAYVYHVETSFAQAAVTFTGQNLGARNYNRIKKSVFLCALIGSLAGILMGVVMYLFGPQLLGLYSPGNEAVIAAGMIRMKLGVVYFISLLMEVGLSMLRGMGQTVLPTISTFVGTCVLRLGWILIVFPMYPCQESLYWSFVFSWVLTAIFNGICCVVVFRKSKREYDTNQLAEI